MVKIIEKVDISQKLLELINVLLKEIQAEYVIDYKVAVSKLIKNLSLAHLHLTD